MIAAQQHSLLLGDEPLDSCQTTIIKQHPVWDDCQATLVIWPLDISIKICIHLVHEWIITKAAEGEIDQILGFLMQ